MSEEAAVVFVVDDDPAVLKGLSRLMRAAGLSVVTFGSPREFLERHDAGTAGCLVLDVAMPGLNGLELQEALTAKGSEIPIVFLTGRGDIPTSVRAMKHGALDFLTKPVNDKVLLRAVQAAIARDRGARVSRADLQEIRARLATLTPRERQVLEHVISGRLNKQTAADLGTAENTVKVHRARVMEKMKVQSVAELVRLADKARITPAPPPPRS